MILKIFYQKILLLSLVVLTLAIHSCNKESECEGSQSAKLINMTGLDGCSWMIKLGDGTKLEPTNLNDFNINLQENQKNLGCIPYCCSNGKYLYAWRNSYHRLYFRKIATCYHLLTVLKFIEFIFV